MKGSGRAMRFYIVDAFTEDIFGGNPAGVVVLSGAAYPSDELMQKIAAELRYSETAFILPRGENVFQLRYFTPKSEVELCGHATIAAFCALQNEGLVEWEGLYLAKTLAGELNIVTDKGFILMDMATPEALDIIDNKEELERLYNVMGLSASQGIATLDKEWILYPEIISTGLPDILLPVADPIVLSDIEPDFKALAELSKEYKVTGVHAFALGEGLIEGVCAGDRQITAYCRNFAPLVGIDEEAATGTANGALTYYLYKNALIDDGAECLFLQGEAMKRPSTILSRVSIEDDLDMTSSLTENIRIQVGGAAAILAKGEIFY
jgi:PhzF family phenazine biosynthesis protein